MFTIPSLSEPTKFPNPLTADPAPNAAIPSATAPMPLPASISAAPFSSSKLFIPSAIVGSVFPTIHVAPAIAPPINTIDVASPAAPSTTAGLAKAIMPPARPLSIPPSPLPIPLPTLPIPLPRPPPLLLLPPSLLLSLSPPPNKLPTLFAIPLVIAPAAALPRNNAPIPATNAPTTPALSQRAPMPSVKTVVIAENHPPLATFSEKVVR